MIRLRHKTLILAFLLSFCVFAEAKPLHPKAFEMVLSWVSDKEQPVVTQVNLDAMRGNNDQFDYSAVEQDGKRVRYSQNDETISYWLEDSGDGKTRAHVVQGGSGSLSMQIDFQILKKRVKIDGLIKEIEVLDVVASLRCRTKI